MNSNAFTAAATADPAAPPAPKPSATTIACHHHYAILAWLIALTLPDLSIWHFQDRVGLGPPMCSPRHSAAGRMMFLGF